MPQSYKQYNFLIYMPLFYFIMFFDNVIYIQNMKFKDKDKSLVLISVKGPPFYNQLINCSDLFIYSSKLQIANPYDRRNII